MTEPQAKPAPSAAEGYLTEHKHTIRARFTGQPATDRSRYQILFITEGQANGWTFSRQVLQDSAQLWEQSSVFVDHSLWGHSVRDLGGVLSNIAWSEEFAGLTAELTAAGPSREIITEAAALMLNEDTRPDVGFSADVIFTADAHNNVQKIIQPISVDFVIDPAFATHFIRQLNQKGVHMTEPIKTAPPAPPADHAQSGSEGEAAAVHEIRKEFGSLLLDAQLANCDLPEAAQKAIRLQYSGQAFPPSALAQTIQSWKDGIAATSKEKEIKGPGRVTGMFDSHDQLQAAMDDLIGAPRDEAAKTLKVAKFSGIREAYVMLTGDRDFVGGYHPEHVHIQFQSGTTDFPGLVKNALNKALVTHWAALGRAGYDWWQKIATVEHFESVNDITWLITGTVASLPTVAEGAEYTELVIGDGAETSSFVKKGGYIGLTLEAMDRDLTRQLRAIPRELANAGLREISATVAAIFTQNTKAGPTMADTGALFNNTAVTTAGGHKNLLTTALGTDYTAWGAVALAMYKQPMLVKNATGYYGAGKYMAVEPKYCLIPRDLKAAADALFMPRWASAVTAIATAGGPTFGGMVEPVVVPEWTNASDWASAADPAIMPAIMIGERFGLLPQIFLAGSDTDPAMFANDEVRLKVRHFIAVGVADFRPLSKNNI